jgi:hypothetical protein
MQRVRSEWTKDKKYYEQKFYIHQQIHLVLESNKIYIKIHIKMLLHVSVCDHHQGARTWA